MVLQIISWYKFFVRRINGLTKTSKLQLETRPTITTIALQLRGAAVGRDGNNLKDVKDFRAENGSRQGQNLALTGLCVPSSLVSGCQHSHRRPFVGASRPRSWSRFLFLGAILWGIVVKR